MPYRQKVNNISEYINKQITFDQVTRVCSSIMAVTTKLTLNLMLLHQQYKLQGVHNKLEATIKMTSLRFQTFISFLRHTIWKAVKGGKINLSPVARLPIHAPDTCQPHVKSRLFLLSTYYFPGYHCSFHRSFTKQAQLLLLFINSKISVWLPCSNKFLHN